MGQILISDLDIIKTYSERSQEAAIKYREAIAMSNKGLEIGEISEYLGEYYEKVRSWIRGGRKPTPIKAIEKLKRMDLLPLESFDPNNKKHEMLVKLHAFVHGDGTLYDGQIALYGQEEDLKEIKGELHYIFPEVKTYLRGTAPGGLVSYGVGYLLMVYSAHLARCLIALGAPRGDKVLSVFDVPTWLVDSPKVSKLWLEVFLGNEGTALESGSDHKYYPLQIQLSKHIELENDVLRFLNGLRSLFSEFGVTTSISKRRFVTIRKRDKKEIGGYYFNIYGDVFNLIRFIDTFRFRYAKGKQLKNDKNIKRVKVKHRQYLEQINAFLVAKKLKYFGFRYGKLKEYYEVNSRISDVVAWNTFYSYSKESGLTPRYLNKFTLYWPGKNGTVLPS